MRGLDVFSVSCLGFLNPGHDHDENDGSTSLITGKDNKNNNQDDQDGYIKPGMRFHSSDPKKEREKKSKKSDDNNENKNDDNNNDGIKDKMSTKSDNRRKLLRSPSLYGYESSWYSLGGYGTFYDISSVDGQELYYSGSLCNDNSTVGYNDGMCDIRLPAGTYMWRVSGALDVHKDLIAWEFCDVYGGATSELIFKIDNWGKCSPVKVEMLDDIISTSQSNDMTEFTTSTITLEGDIMITGVKSAELGSTDLKILKKAIAQEFTQATSQLIDADTSVSILSYSNLEKMDPTSRLLDENNRGLTEWVTFRVDIPAKSSASSPISTAYKKGEFKRLVDDIKIFLQTSTMGMDLEKRLFVAKILSEAQLTDGWNLRSVEYAELRDLRYLETGTVTEEQAFLLGGGLVLAIVTLVLIFVVLVRQSLAKEGSKFPIIVKLPTSPFQRTSVIQKNSTAFSSDIEHLTTLPSTITRFSSLHASLTSLYDDDTPFDETKDKSYSSKGRHEVSL